MQGSLLQLSMDLNKQGRTQMGIENLVNTLDLSNTHPRDLPSWLLESAIKEAGCNPKLGGNYLLDCIGAGYAEIVQQLLAAGMSPETAVHGIPPVFMAACSGQPEMIRILVGAGADPDAARGEGVPKDTEKRLGRAGDTPLVGAVSRGGLGCVRVLLEVGADVNKADSSDAAPIHHVVGKGLTEIVRVLAEAGADLNRENGDRSTPLSMAILTDTLEMVEVLVAAGADINRMDPQNRFLPPLHEAASHGFEAIVRCLLNAGADVRLDGLSGCDALMLAAMDGHLGVVKLLVEAGADVNLVRDASIFTPLFAAAIHGHLAVVRFLVEVGGADVDKPDPESGGTPLMCACSSGHLEIAKCLIKAGANPSAICLDGHTTPLSHAVGSGCVDIVEFLLQKGARDRRLTVSPSLPVKLLL